MKEWFIQNFDASVIVALCTFVTGLASAITSLILNLRSASTLKALQREKAPEGSYAVCPECHAKIAIHDLEFHLANGALDNDLDGIADEMQG